MVPMGTAEAIEILIVLSAVLLLGTVGLAWVMFRPIEKLFSFGGGGLMAGPLSSSVARRCLNTFGRLCEQGRSRTIAAAHS